MEGNLFYRLRRYARRYHGSRISVGSHDYGALPVVRLSTRVLACLRMTWRSRSENDTLLRAGAALEGSAIGTHATPALLDALTAAGAVLTPAIVRSIAYSALNSRDGKLAVLKWLVAHDADLLARDAKGLTVIEGQFFGARNPKAVALIKSLAKPAPKRPSTAAKDVPALTALGTQLGVAAKKAADDSGDIGYYRREADLALPRPVGGGFISQQEGKGIVPVAERAAGE